MVLYPFNDSYVGFVHGITPNRLTDATNFCSECRKPETKSRKVPDSWPRPPPFARKQDADTPRPESHEPRAPPRTPHTPPANGLDHPSAKFHHFTTDPWLLTAST